MRLASCVFDSLKVSAYIARERERRVRGLPKREEMTPLQILTESGSGYLYPGRPIFCLTGSKHIVCTMYVSSRVDEANLVKECRERNDHP